MTHWRPCRILILKHPRLKIGEVYDAEIDDEGVYVVQLAPGEYETVWNWEAAEVLEDVERDWEDQ